MWNVIWDFQSPPLWSMVEKGNGRNCIECQPKNSAEVAITCLRWDEKDFESFCLGLTVVSVPFVLSYYPIASDFSLDACGRIHWILSSSNRLSYKKKEKKWNCLCLLKSKSTQAPTMKKGNSEKFSLFRDETWQFQWFQFIIVGGGLMNSKEKLRKFFYRNRTVLFSIFVLYLDITAACLAPCVVAPISVDSYTLAIWKL